MEKGDEEGMDKADAGGKCSRAKAREDVPLSQMSEGTRSRRENPWWKEPPPSDGCSEAERTLKRLSRGKGDVSRRHNVGGFRKQE